MPENIWEELVGTYLTTNRAVLLSPQYEITDERGGTTCPDFLAVDFQARKIWFVEVTAAWNTDKIRGKAKTFKDEIMPQLKKQLVDSKIIPDASQWAFGLLAFVRKEVADKLREKIAPHVPLCEVKELEEIAFKWTYWDKRRAGEIAAEQDARSMAASSKT
jgi:hypothetical protein